jgi:uncharacterized peroxidase-related enzyme
MESHEPDLRAEVRDETRVRKIQEDYTRAALEPATVVLLDFAQKLTLEPRGMSSRDVEKLRANGFTDVDVVDAVQLIAYFNYVNRVLDGLGAEPEPGMRFRHAHS